MLKPFLPSSKRINYFHYFRLPIHRKGIWSAGTGSKYMSNGFNLFFCFNPPIIITMTWSEFKHTKWGKNVLIRRMNRLFDFDFNQYHLKYFSFSIVGMISKVYDKKMNFYSQDLKSNQIIESRFQVMGVHKVCLAVTLMVQQLATGLTIRKD